MWLVCKIKKRKDKATKEQYQELPNQDNPPIEIGIIDDNDTNFLVSYDLSSYVCDTLSTYYVSKSKFFFSYVQKKVMLMKSEMEKMDHQCWLDLFQTDKSPSAREDGIRNCDVFFTLLTKSYLSQRDCLMELAWAMKHNKNIQPLYLPADKDKIGLWSNMSPKAFQWIFATKIHPVLDTDSRLLAGTLPTIVSDAKSLTPCPTLPDGCSAEQLVDQAILEIE